MRYQNQKILKDDNGNRYQNRIKYPVIPISDSDIIVTGRLGLRFDNLAYQYYGNQELWWIIARANNQNNGSMYLQSGKEYRIPQNIGTILRNFENLNR